MILDDELCWEMSREPRGDLAMHDRGAGER
jgi:hypothetical protein